MSTLTSSAPYLCSANAAPLMQEDFPHAMEHFDDDDVTESDSDEDDLPPQQPEPKRNKRKNFKPRNILYAGKENSDGQPGDGEDPDLDAEAVEAVEAVRRRRKPTTAPQRRPQHAAPMDLSFSRGAALSDTNSDSEGAFFHHGDAFPQPGADASAMKEYAENTMKELLGIYGLSGADMAETITKSVPIANFSSGKILETLSLKQPGQTAPSPPTPPRTPFSPPHKAASAAPETPVATAATAATAVDLHRQRAALTNHRVMLPQDMATILTLAAMQERKLASPLPTTPSAYVFVDPSPKNGGSVHGHGHRMSPLSPSRDAGNAKPGVPVDYSRYVKRFGSAVECGNAYCKDLNYREHFHCLDCNSRVFVKKEEMIRHFKWHKKRDESLQHGFMRYSPMDDCSDRYRGCSHNRKQTHYHCIKEGCDKVYISTSDVQMHANYHRKDSAIIQEGFQRFRATEECGAAYCSFFGQRTTHFHCRRDNCKYTFKNKADMEKHKTYHIKDEQLNRDGFKKFMKNENCPFESCRFSRVCNHIHCIRTGCNYVLHSSGQLFSHKRKHERQDSEMAYRKYKLAQSMIKTFSEGQQPNILQAFNDHLSQQSETSVGAIQTSVIQQGPSSVGVGVPGVPPSQNGDSGSGRSSPASFSKYNPLTGVEGSGSLPTTPHCFGMPLQEQTNAMDLSNDSLNASNPWTGEDFWQKYLARYGPSEKCVSGGQCEHIFKEHYHCGAEGCEMTFRLLDSVREHARNHEQQEQVSEAFYITVEAGGPCQCEEDCPYQTKEKHYHCTWDNCREVILPSDKPFRRLDHYKMHEYSRKLSLTKDPLTMTHLATSIDGMFRRKRGRPPKNRVIEVWNDYFPMAPGSVMDSPQAIFTSFKLPKPSTVPTPQTPSNQPGLPVVCADVKSPTSPEDSLKYSTPINSQNQIELLQEGFYSFGEGVPCPDALCPFNTRSQHFHCNQPRCFYVTDREDILIMHSKDFHDNIDIMEGFRFFDRTVDCRMPSCHSNKLNRHFHCVRAGCGYSFVRYSAMALHEQKHRSEDGETNIESSSAQTENHETLSQTIKKHETDGSPVHIKIEPMQMEAEASQVKKEIIMENMPLTNCSSPNATSPVQIQSSQATPSPETPLNRTTVVKASGTFYPLSAFSCEPGPQYGKGGISKSSWGTSPSPPSPSRCNIDVIAATSSNKIQLVTDSVKSEACYTRETSPQSLTRLLQQPQVIQESSSRPDWMLPERHVRYGPEQSCSRPFCKLKRKEHYHCNVCNQAFSEMERLRPHIAKHNTGALSPSVKKELEDNNNEESNDSSNNIGAPPCYEQSGPTCEVLPTLHPPTVFPPHTSTAASFNAAMAAAAAAGQQFALITSQGIPFIQPGIPTIYTSPAGLMFAAPPSLHSHHPHHHHNGLLEHHQLLSGEPEQAMALAGMKRSLSPHLMPPTPLDMSPEAKKARVQNSMRILKDEPVPEGYIRFRFNEDCKYPHCGYREHQTHFHCMRSDCGYSFCDKTRFVQHTARHERLDTLMGGDFQQFRANVACGRQECVYTSTLGAMQNKASHFHCLKCEFVCTDTNKVVAHRRQHQKLDSIMAAGFEKFTPSQPCNIESCAHSGKQTHYHCLSCQYAVLGLSQMSAHKYRHME